MLFTVFKGCGQADLNVSVRNDLYSIHVGPNVWPRVHLGLLSIVRSKCYTMPPKAAAKTPATKTQPLFKRRQRSTAIEDLSSECNHPLKVSDRPPNKKTYVVDVGVLIWFL